MGFLQKLEAALGVRADNELTEEEERRYLEAQKSGIRKRKALERMDEMAELPEPEPTAFDPNQDLEVADPLSEMGSAEVPELAADESQGDMDTPFLDAVEQQITAPAPPEDGDVTKVADQRQRADDAVAERDAKTRQLEADELAELNQAYADKYSDIQDVRAGETDTREAEVSKVNQDYADSYDDIQATRTGEEPVSEEGAEEISEADQIDPRVAEDRAMKLFETTHGGKFDPKSSMDKGKMDVIRAQMAKDPDLLSLDDEEFDKRRNKFALSIYRL